MEHSALHAFQLGGLLVLLAGPILALLFLGSTTTPPQGTPDVHGTEWLVSLHSRIARTTALGAWIAATAGFIDLFVQVAEVDGRTVFAGVPLNMVWTFATLTITGKLMVGRITTLTLTGLIAWLGRRTPSTTLWLLALTGGILATTLATLVSHAAAQPGTRWIPLLLQGCHLASAATWIGTLIHLLTARSWIESADHREALPHLSRLIDRFSPVALLAATALLLSGLAAAARFLSTPDALLTSAYGLSLSVKLLLLLPVLYAGWIHFQKVRPALHRLTTNPNRPETQSWLQRFSRTLELEVTAGILVITVAGIVGSVSPPGEEGAFRLTQPQVHALLSPDFPTTQVVDPSRFVGAATRTIDDLRYAEFTHNWSGVAVIALGLCWFIQVAGTGRTIGTWAARAWPFLLIPFAAFITIASDPEIWILRSMTPLQAIADPAVLEHQLGAVMVLAMAWMGWRDGNREPSNRPLGPALPIIMILGSLLLLGHAHSALTVAEDTTNLINVQHAVFGILGLLAGTVRWFEIRKLITHRAASLTWPALVTSLGIFMAFFYREIL